MDFSIPPTLPVNLQNKLSDIVQDYKDGNLTVKGYETKRLQLLENSTSDPKRSVSNVRANTIRIPGRNQSLSSTLIQKRSSNLNLLSRNDSVYRVTTNSSIASPSIMGTSIRHKRHSSTQLSLPSRDILSNGSYNPMVPLLPRKVLKNDNTLMASLPSILRGRSENYAGQNAIININSKGKETFISWDKLYLRAEKVAHELNKNNLYKMDKVLLWYNKDEVIEFAVAILGCFIAGMIAVPVSFDIYSLGEIIEILKTTNSKFILISNDCYKHLDNLYSANNNKIKLNKNENFSNVIFCKTDDLGTYSKAKKHAPTFDLSTIAYIEFTRTPLGRLSGVVMKHKVLNSQLSLLAKILNSRTMPHWKKNEIMKPHNHKIKPIAANKKLSGRFNLVNTLDPTRSTGLICGIFFNVFSGNLLINVDDNLLSKSGSYENIIDKYRADILLNDQLQLKQIVINYLENPDVVAERRKHKVDFSCIKCCLTSCNTIDVDVTDMVVNKWLKNLGCIDANLCYSPVLTLLDFGGIFLSIKDQLGHSSNFAIHNAKLRHQDELYINKEQLKGNCIETSIDAMASSTSSFKDYLKLETFGFPLPETLLCVVNPDDSTLVPDLTVGEIWVSSDNLIDQFYQMDKVNDFVFKAKLNHTKMFSFISESSDEDLANFAIERLNFISSICPPTTQFLRTKLIGFVYNGKVYVLSLIEDMFLQNKLLRLPNWAHTSDLKKEKASSSGNTASTGGTTIVGNQLNESSLSLPSLATRRVVQTHYLQQITESIVRTVATIYEVSAFELNHHQSEHFLVVVVESSLAKKPQLPANLQSGSSDRSLLAGASQKDKDVLEKKMNDLTDQIYRVLWIFHKIQPMCILVVPKDTLPKRYCSLELANSIVEKKFSSGELNSSFVRFQFDNVILDFVPHSNYYNESIFSQHLSVLRRSFIESTLDVDKDQIDKSFWQTSGIDYREYSYDGKSPKKKVTDFKSILEVLEWRIEKQGNETAFNDGDSNTTSNSNDNNVHKKVSWKTFDLIVGSFLKKIVASKTPLKSGDKVIIMCENAVEYVAMVMACFYCNLVIIPLKPLSERNLKYDFRDLANIIKSYKVKRVFMDSKVNNFLSNNTVANKLFKNYRYLFPKITVFSKLKKKQGINIKLFRNVLKDKFGHQRDNKLNTAPVVIWISNGYDVSNNIHVAMTHFTLMNSSKIIKETLQLGPNSPIFSLYSHTRGLGFIMSCLLGIYVGTSTDLFSYSTVMSDPKNILLGIQNLNIKNLYMNIETFGSLLDKASNLMKSKAEIVKHKGSQRSSASNLRFDFFKDVENLMIPFSGRPRTTAVENLLNRYQSILLSVEQINYVYEHHFNSIISLRSYLDLPPIDLFLDPVSMREGIVEELNPNSAEAIGALRLQDSGVVPVCTDVSIVNPETLVPCLEGEIGEIWCCSEGNASNYAIMNKNGTLTKDDFIDEQFKSRFEKDSYNGLTYLRTGDLGFIKNVQVTNTKGDLISLNLLYVLGPINETIDVLGLTHFVGDLEKSVKDAHHLIKNCIISKAGGLLVCLIRCKDNTSTKYGNITALLVSELLNKHGVVLDLCSFVKSDCNNRILNESWSSNRFTIMQEWFNRKITIGAQYGVNYGENISIYLLSDFEKENK
ncbi:hypothetical protein KAFR_0J01890 [Kazachstania africana CBS 2517]|uniref:DMAP1-binding domain-containing protein n=1 Tax=Kazachstania africana (strain ATCC 22294 / BCRC 22015 / CBS 2517 / CECT 1963 / NBRC 1671 / NRRL Y-8276) TaxID=1071382 RepID=H2B0V3_KAZAF|nr:hypothetical protein KAFR_0J01890 [Kazachstania africana CBS 2517]CCF60253.1 hypothetical protein KAFR_0J01890 [Kazachstania africana CBS 2517]